MLPVLPLHRAADSLLPWFIEIPMDRVPRVGPSGSAVCAAPATEHLIRSRPDCAIRGLASLSKTLPVLFLSFTAIIMSSGPGNRSLPFSVFCIRLERILEVKKSGSRSIQDARRAILFPKSMIEMWRSWPADADAGTARSDDPAGSELAPENRSIGDIAPYIRLLLPQESQRNFGMKERSLATTLAAALNRKSLQKTLEDAKKHVGNFGAAVEKYVDAAGERSLFRSYRPDIRGKDILEAWKSPRRRGVLTVAEVDHMLHRLHVVNRSGSKTDKSEKRKAIMREAVQAMAPWELRWFVSIVLKFLHIRMDYRSILPALHPDALAVFQSNADLNDVCYSEILRDPTQKAFSSVKPFNMIMPMLAERVHSRAAHSEHETMRRACLWFTQSNDGPAAGGMAATGTAAMMDDFGGLLGDTGAGPIEEDDDETVRGRDFGWLRRRHQGGFFVEDKLDGHRLLIHKRLPQAAGGGASSAAAASSSSSSSAAAASGQSQPGLMAGGGVQSEVMCFSRMRIVESRFCAVL